MNAFIVPAGLNNKSAPSNGFEAVRAQAGEKFPWVAPLSDEFVCTPMDLNIDPLDPGENKGRVKPLSQAYLEFLVRHTLATACERFFVFCCSACLAFSLSSLRLFSNSPRAVRKQQTRVLVALG